MVNTLNIKNKPKSNAVISNNRQNIYIFNSRQNKYIYAFGALQIYNKKFIFTCKVKPKVVALSKLSGLGQQRYP